MPVGDTGNVENDDNNNQLLGLGALGTMQVDIVRESTIHVAEHFRFHNQFDASIEDGYEQEHWQEIQKQNAPKIPSQPVFVKLAH